MGNYNQNYKSNQKEMFKAVCADCGASCEVPFKPRNDKPIYCSKCFENRSDGRDRNDRGQNNRKNDRGRNDRSNRDMFKAVCAECGASCEVPFRPSSDKPVYCDSCFSGRSNNNTRRETGMGGKAISSDQFNILNSKLNAILKSLGATTSENIEEKKPTPKIIKPVVKNSTIKPATKKTPAKKKTKKSAPKKTVKKTTVKKVVKKAPAKKKK